MAGPNPHSNMLASIARQTIPLITREFPVHIVHVVDHGDDLATQRVLHPIFFGCFDWHSAVHSYWQLLRIRRTLVGGGDHPEVVADIDAVLDQGLGDIAGLQTELTYLDDRPSFERPYGLAWLLYLARELRLDADRSDADRRSSDWAANMAPLESGAASNLAAWVSKLEFPVRGGLHNQSAFSMSLTWDWAMAAGRTDVVEAVRSAAIAWYADDRNAPIDYEPSASDFLSPTLGVSSLMLRVLPHQEFLDWLDRYLPDLLSDAGRRWLEPVAVTDPTDGRLAHFAGLNLSRSWMLDELANILPADHRDRSVLANAAQRQLTAGLSDTLTDEYMLSHWVPSFAVYALTHTRHP